MCKKKGSNWGIINISTDFNKEKILKQLEQRLWAMTLYTEAAKKHFA